MAALAHGNRCGHEKKAPRWFRRAVSKGRLAKILEEFKERIKRYFNSPALVFPALNNVNCSDRRQRSERREACLLVLGCLADACDLVTLRVGVPRDDGSFAGITTAEIAERTSMNVRRVERAVHDLREAQMITVHPIAEKLADSTYQGFAAIRTIALFVFEAVGLGAWLKHERRKASERAKGRKKPTREGIAKVGMLMKAGFARAAKAAQDAVTTPPTTTPAPDSGRPEFRSIRDIIAGRTPPTG